MIEDRGSPVAFAFRLSRYCKLILQKVYILSTTDQASLHDFGDYNLND